MDRRSGKYYIETLAIFLFWGVRSGLHKRIPQQTLFCQGHGRDNGWCNFGPSSTGYRTEARDRICLVRFYQLQVMTRSVGPLR